MRPSWSGSGRRGGARIAAPMQSQLAERGIVKVLAGWGSRPPARRSAQLRSGWSARTVTSITVILAQTNLTTRRSSIAIALACPVCR